MQPIYTVDQVAGHFGKSSRTIRKWIASGKLLARKVGKGYIVTEEAINNMLRPATTVIDDRKIKAAEFISFMQSLNIPKGTVSRIMAEDCLAESASRMEARE